MQIFAYGPADATATPSSLFPVKFRMLTFLVPAYPGCPGKRPLNGCSSSSSSSSSSSTCSTNLLTYFDITHPSNHSYLSPLKCQLILFLHQPSFTAM